MQFSPVDFCEEHLDFPVLPNPSYSEQNEHLLLGLVGAAENMFSFSVCSRKSRFKCNI